MSSPPPVITSPQNPMFREWRRLLTGRGMKKQAKALVAGAKIVSEAVSTLPDRCEAWITAGERMPGPPRDLPHYTIAPELFQTLDIFGTHSPLLVVRPPEIGSWDPKTGLPGGLSVLVPFQDPENVGAVIRSATAFGADCVILLEESAHPFHPKALRASGGTVLTAHLRTGPRLPALPVDLPLTPLSKEGTPIHGYDFPDPCGLLAGVEGQGLPSVWRERAVSIPIEPAVESLNASAGVAIALYLWSRQRRANGRT